MKFNIKKKLLSIWIDWDYDKYWNSRDALYDKKTNKLKYFFCKAYVSKQNRKQAADIAYNVKAENNFKDHPKLGHKLNGIVIAAEAKIGYNCFISHQVTIGRSKGGVPTIGDNVYIGPGAKIFGNIKIGNNVRIGANCVVFEDVPDNSTIVLPKPRIIVKDENYKYYIINENE